MVSKTIKGVKQNGEEIWYSPQELRATKLNKWKGWLCSVGQNNIAITENGDMKGKFSKKNSDGTTAVVENPAW